MQFSNTSFILKPCDNSDAQLHSPILNPLIPTAAAQAPLYKCSWKGAQN